MKSRIGGWGWLLFICMEDHNPRRLTGPSQPWALGALAADPSRIFQLQLCCAHLSASTAHTNAMATMPSTRLLRPGLASTPSDALLVFLVPSAQCAHNGSRACFSTSPQWRKRDNNKIRGVSAVRATALRPRQTLSVRQKDFEKQQLPKPVPIEHKVTGTPDHGLWGFFKDQKLLQTPVDEQRHGIQQLASWRVRR